MPVPADRVMGPLPQPRPSGPEIRPVSHMPPPEAKEVPARKRPAQPPSGPLSRCRVRSDDNLALPPALPSTQRTRRENDLPRPPHSRWLVYILRCSDGSLYCGITNDLPKRLKAHAAGRASKYTRSRLPVRLAYSEPQKSKSAALKREAVIKRLRRAEKDRLVARG